MSLTLSREIGFRRGEAWAHSSLGKMFRSLGNLKEARARLEESLTLYQEIGQRHDEANTLVEPRLARHRRRRPGRGGCASQFRSGHFPRISCRPGDTECAARPRATCLHPLRQVESKGNIRGCVGPSARGREGWTLSCSSAAFSSRRRQAKGQFDRSARQRAIRSVKRRAMRRKSFRTPNPSPPPTSRLSVSPTPNQSKSLRWLRSLPEHKRILFCTGRERGATTCGELACSSSACLFT